MVNILMIRLLNLINSKNLSKYVVLVLWFGSYLYLRRPAGDGSGGL